MNLRKVAAFFEKLASHKNTGHTSLMNTLSCNGNVIIIVRRVEDKENFDPACRQRVLTVDEYMQDGRGTYGSIVLMDNSTINLLAAKLVENDASVKMAIRGIRNSIRDLNGISKTLEGSQPESVSGNLGSGEASLKGPFYPASGSKESR